jgi:hypothetical protein
MKLRPRLWGLIVLVAVLALGLGAEVARRRAIESEKIAAFYEQLEEHALFRVGVATRGLDHSKSMNKQNPGDPRWPKQEAWWQEKANDANRRSMEYRRLSAKYHSEKFHIWKILIIPPPPEAVPLLPPTDLPLPLEWLK